MQQEIKKYFDDKGHLNELGVSYYVYALLTENTEALEDAILQHVEECQQCKKEIMDNYKLGKEIDIVNFAKGNDKKTIKISTNKRKFDFILKVAAVFIAFIALGYLTIMFIQPGKKGLTENKFAKKEEVNKKNDKEIKPNNEDTSAKEIENNTKTVKQQNKRGLKPGKDKIPKKQNIDHLLAQNFEESPNLENFVHMNVRSEAVFNVVYPALSAEFKPGKDILFQWESTSEKAITIKILSNKEKVLDQIDGISENKYTYKNKLKPGLYYWKAETREDLFYTGKFFIKE